MKIFLKKTISISLIFILLVLPTFLLTPFISTVNAADCVGGLSLLQETPDGGNIIHGDGTSITLSSQEAYLIKYNVHSGYSSAACFGQYQYSIDVNSAGSLVDGTTNGSPIDDSVILSNVVATAYTFTLSISRLGNSIYSTALHITFVKGAGTDTSGSGGSTPPSSADAYPKAGSVCKNSDTSSTIYWTTSAKVGARLHYNGPTGGGVMDQKTKASTIHSFKISSLVKGDTYNFTDESLDSNGKTIPNTVTPSMSFVAGADSETGCDSYTAGKSPPGATNSNSNSGPPNNSLPNNAINTGISANFGSLDTNLGEFFNPIKPDSVPSLITSIIRILFLLISIAAVITIIVAGFRMVLASGNETELTNAKKAITWAIIGLIVSLMSFSIVAIVQSLIKK